MDEVFGAENFGAQITFRKTTGTGGRLLDTTVDFILWYAKSKEQSKFRSLYDPRTPSEEVNLRYLELEGGRRRPMTQDEFKGAISLPNGARIYRPNPLTSARLAQGSDLREYEFCGRIFRPGMGTFKTNKRGLDQLAKSNRLLAIGSSLNFLRYFQDFSVKPVGDVWEDTRTGGFGDERFYVVQTVAKVIQRCILMTTDPGDLVLDPTCGSGTTAFVAEQWGRRWITIDTSRVALALARTRPTTSTRSRGAAAAPVRRRSILRRSSSTI
jgi:adenine-specific DNA-methyltransferase